MTMKEAQPRPRKSSDKINMLPELEKMRIISIAAQHDCAFSRRPMPIRLDWQANLPFAYAQSQGKHLKCKGEEKERRGGRE